MLATERLRLAPLADADSAGMYALWSDPAVCEYSGTVRDYAGNVIDMPARTREASDRIIDFWQRAAADGWGFRWAVSLEGEFTGTVGFNSLRECAEIAYHLRPTFWGRGIMQEAATAAIAWLGDRATAVEAFIEPDNQASIALAIRLELHATPTFSEGAQRYVRSLKND